MSISNTMKTQIDDLKKERKKYVLFILEEKLKQAPNYDSIKHAQQQIDRIDNYIFNIK